ncbi:hypothetical protein FA95DRAFT_1603333 [Auriscalpium vulgare]|uniref:Uncharacterized protein n=1 Tax=Auriscalpium vulgare TaxID=40419 RepID=A0ACB8S2T0_9AGAM|nr:hypothetical protein FA95DRAFT_1603333 [Auriscalpium vulgare]
MSLSYSTVLDLIINEPFALGGRLLPLFDLPLRQQPSDPSASFASLIHSIRASGPHGEAAMLTLRTRLIDALRPFFPNPTAFQQQLGRCNAVVSGSFVLAFLLAYGREPLHWTPGDIDVYCTTSQGASMLDFLIRDCHYLPQLLGDAHSRYQLADISHVFRLSNPQLGKTVDVICTDSPSPLAPITHFWGTHLMNFVSATSIVSAYAAPTLLRNAALNPNRELTAEDEVVFKYKCRGFVFTPFRASTLVHSLDPRPCACPHTLRSFADEHTVSVRYEDIGDNADAALHDGPQWKWGGDRCGRGCGASPNDHGAASSLDVDS